MVFNADLNGKSDCCWDTKSLRRTRIKQIDPITSEPPFFLHLGVFLPFQFLG